jgi:hypothetical protein
LRKDANCAVVTNSTGKEVGYINKKDIANIVKPLVDDAA